MYIKFIFVLWYVIVAFGGTTLPFYFSLQRLNHLVNESVVEVPAFQWEWGSKVGTATCYGLESPGFNPWWGEGIFCSPELVKTVPGPLLVSFSGYWGSSGAMKRAWCWPPTPHLMLQLVQSRGVTILSHCAFTLPILQELHSSLLGCDTL